MNNNANSRKIVNVAAHLERMAQAEPDRLAVAYPKSRNSDGHAVYINYTFQQLNRDSDIIATGLKQYGIDRGTRTILMVPPSPDFFAVTFALFKIGAVLVIVDPGMGVRNLKQCIAEAEPEAFIGIPKAHAARGLLGWGRTTIRYTVTVGRRYGWGGTTLSNIRDSAVTDGPYTIADSTADETAAILFTSGSTGPPKGVVYTHGIFAHQLEMLRSAFGIESGEVDLCTFPLFALYAPAWGISAVIPDMDFSRPAQANPAFLVQAVNEFGVTHLFGSPALIDRLGRYGVANSVKLPTIKRIVSAGAPVQPAVIARIKTMLVREAPVYTPYGATESLPLCAISSETILGETAALTAQGRGVCVGKPLPGITLKIIRISDGAIATWSDDLLLATGEIGEIVVQGPIVTREYYHRPEATALAKIQDAETNAFYHRMGDVGYLDGEGRVWYCGRKSQRIICDDGTLFTIPCESIFNSHKDVYRTALVGVVKDGATTPVLCVELESESKNVEAAKVRQELLDLGQGCDQTKRIKTILFHPGLPVDIRHNAKIFREKLVVWAVGKV